MASTSRANAATISSAIPGSSRAGTGDIVGPDGAAFGPGGSDDGRRDTADDEAGVVETVSFAATVVASAVGDVPAEGDGPAGGIAATSTATRPGDADGDPIVGTAAVGVGADAGEPGETIIDPVPPVGIGADVGFATPSRTVDGATAARPSPSPFAGAGAGAVVPFGDVCVGAAAAADAAPTGGDAATEPPVASVVSATGVADAAGTAAPVPTTDDGREEAEARPTAAPAATVGVPPAVSEAGFAAEPIDDAAAPDGADGRDATVVPLASVEPNTAAGAAPDVVVGGDGAAVEAPPAGTPPEDGVV